MKLINPPCLYNSLYLVQRPMEYLIFAKFCVCTFGGTRFQTKNSDKKELGFLDKKHKKKDLMTYQVSMSEDQRQSKGHLEREKA